MARALAGQSHVKSGSARAAQLLSVVALSGCGTDAGPSEHTASNASAITTIDVRRSLVATEQPILERFSFERVMQQLVNQSHVPGLTASKLFRQWWDTQNPKPGLGLGAHCDDQSDAILGPTVNQYPYFCRPAPSEGAQAACDPFSAGSPCAYTPIGLFNRFDIAPENGAYCGEYRIVYAKESGVLDSDARNLLIFEAAMPNPLPLLGLDGCRGLANFWANLSNISDIETRADRLENFYFNGLLSIPPYPPVVHISHFGDNANGRGQIRTNQFIDPTPRIWSLREFKLKRTCGLLSCSSLRFVPVTVKSNPYGPLFDPALPHPRASTFQTAFLGQVDGLSGTTIPEIEFTVADSYNSAQSQANGTEGNYVTQFGAGPSALHTALAAALAARGSSLTPENLVARAQALSCAGCHRLSSNADLGGGIVWPPSLGFVHVSERDIESVDGVTRYLISDALTNEFLPHRKDVFERFLAGSLILNLLSLKPIGGFLTH
ncbi:MAG TPA: hypothetical protein VK524_31435 [Polyangiaceae bacterium]|nr:hypothetical protein [Polyangiaceae bacterium]